MRTLFWRIFASFWLAIVLVAGLSCCWAGCSIRMR